MFVPSIFYPVDLLPGDMYFLKRVVDDDFKPRLIVAVQATALHLKLSVLRNGLLIDDVYDDDQRLQIILFRLVNV